MGDVILEAELCACKINFATKINIKIKCARAYYNAHSICRVV